MAFEVVMVMMERGSMALQEAITVHGEQLKALERAIERLDVLADGGKLWLEYSRRMVRQL